MIPERIESWYEKGPVVRPLVSRETVTGIGVVHAPGDTTLDAKETMVGRLRDEGRGGVGRHDAHTATAKSTETVWSSRTGGPRLREGLGPPRGGLSATDEGRQDNDRANTVEREGRTGVRTTRLGMFVDMVEGRGVEVAPLGPVVTGEVKQGLPDTSGLVPVQPDTPPQEGVLDEETSPTDTDGPPTVVLPPPQSRRRVEGSPTGLQKGPGYTPRSRTSVEAQVARAVRPYGPTGDVTRPKRVLLGRFPPVPSPTRAPGTTPPAVGP